MGEKELSSQNSALVFSDLPEVALELVSAAKKMGAGTIAGAALSSRVDSHIAKLSFEGVNTIY